MTSVKRSLNPTGWPEEMQHQVKGRDLTHLINNETAMAVIGRLVFLGFWALRAEKHPPE